MNWNLVKPGHAVLLGHNNTLNVLPWAPLLEQRPVVVRRRIDIAPDIADRDRTEFAHFLITIE
jgi:hypothetical protein